VTDAALPQRVQRLLMAHIDSLETLETLLLLQTRTEQAWTASAVARELRMTEASAAARLGELTASRLLVTERGAPAKYRYSPASAEDVRSVAELAATYAQRRVSVITFIFSKPLARVRVFADAFLLKRERDEDPDD
jgi:transcriptional regulator with AAA-type ATPase domain